MKEVAVVNDLKPGSPSLNVNISIDPVEKQANKTACALQNARRELELLIEVSNSFMKKE